MLGKSWAVALLMLPLSALAAEGLSYNYFEGNFIVDEQVDLSSRFINGDDDGDGFAVAGSFGLNETWYVNGSYSDSSLDNTEINNLSLGVGAHTSQWTGAWDLFGVLSYEDAQVEVDAVVAGVRRTAEIDDGGFGLAGGLRGSLTDAFELNGQVKYTDVGDADGTSFKVGALYKFGTVWAATADYATGDLGGGDVDVDIDELRVGLRYIF